MKKALIVSLALLFSVAVVYADDPLPAKVFDSCFMVDAGESGSGSGVAVVNGNHMFAWTAGHVVCDLLKIHTVIDPVTGLPKVAFEYKDCTLRYEERQDGRKVAEHLYLAKIIRFSDGRLDGEDLALLQLYAKPFLRKGVKFAEDNEIPARGAPLWHVGSNNGKPGMNTVAEGVFSTAGRLRTRLRDNDTQGRIYDQVTLAALGGCSGGGVFNKADSKCIGLLTEGVTGTAESINFIVPARRIREYAKRTNCLWAIDTKIPVPSDEEIAKTPVTDRPIPLPADWKKPAPTPATAAQPNNIFPNLFPTNP